MRTPRIDNSFGIALIAFGALVLAGCSASGPSPAAAADPTSATSSVGAAATAVPTTGAADVGRRVITVRGVGQVTGTPDTVTIVLGVETTATSAGDALTSNNTKASAVIAMLKGKGVAAKDLQTSRLSINPTHSNKETITGYQVRNQLTVTLHDVKGAGTIIDAAQSAAGDAIRVNRLGFSIGDDSALRASARGDAIRKAKVQAQQMAQAAGIVLGPVVSISESPQDVSPVRTAAAEMADRAAASMPVEAGSRDLNVTVHMVFAIG